MRQLIVTLLAGVVLLAAAWVLAVAPAISDPAADGDANRTGDGWANVSFYGSP